MCAFCRLHVLMYIFMCAVCVAIHHSECWCCCCAKKLIHALRDERNRIRYYLDVYDMRMTLWLFTVRMTFSMSFISSLLPLPPHPFPYSISISIQIPCTALFVCPRISMSICLPFNMLGCHTDTWLSHVFRRAKYCYNNHNNCCCQHSYYISGI